MGNEYLNKVCICYLEKGASAKVDIELVMKWFQGMKT